jgi:hypothetical protein
MLVPNVGRFVIQNSVIFLRVQNTSSPIFPEQILPALAGTSC